MRNICTVVLKKNISADWYKSGEWLGCRYFRGWRVWGENYEIQDWNDNENKLSRPRWCAKGIWKDTFSRLIFVMVAIRKTSRMLISMSQRKETQFKCASFLNCILLVLPHLWMKQILLQAASKRAKARIYLSLTLSNFVPQRWRSRWLCLWGGKQHGGRNWRLEVNSKYLNQPNDSCARLLLTSAGWEGLGGKGGHHTPGWLSHIHRQESKNISFWLS